MVQRGSAHQLDKNPELVEGNSLPKAAAAGIGLELADLKSATFVQSTRGEEHKEKGKLKDQDPSQGLTVGEDYTIYTVKKDDYLGEICQKQCGTIKHLQTVIDINKKLAPNPGKISAPQKLVLPTQAFLSGRDKAEVVASLSKIAEKVYQEQQEAKTDKALQIGYVLVGGTTLKVSPYTVKPGDSFSKIAQYLGHSGTFDAIKVLNKGISSKKLKPGNTLKVPDKEQLDKLFSNLDREKPAEWNLPSGSYTELAKQYAPLINVAKGKAPTKKQMASKSHFNDRLIKKTYDKASNQWKPRMHGNSRKVGDASPEVQAYVIHEVLKLCHEQGLSIGETTDTLLMLQHESGFNPDAASFTSASGPGQYTDATRKRLCDRQGIDVSKEDIFGMKVTRCCIEEGFFRDSFRAALLNGARPGGSDFLVQAYGWHYSGLLKDGAGQSIARKEIVPRREAAKKCLEKLLLRND